MRQDKVKEPDTMQSHLNILAAAQKRKATGDNLVLRRCRLLLVCPHFRGIGFQPVISLDRLEAYPTLVAARPRRSTNSRIVVFLRAFV